MIFLVGWLKQPLEKIKSLSQIGSFLQSFKTSKNQQPQIYESTTSRKIQVRRGLGLTGARWFSRRDLLDNPLIGGHQQALKRFTIPKRVTAWITRCKGFFSILDHQKQSQKPPCWVVQALNEKVHESYESFSLQ